MFAVFTLLAAAVSLVRGQDDIDETVSICSRWRNVVTDCWTNIYELPTAADYATCICADPASATFVYATVFDSNAEACADYYNIVDPTLAQAYTFSGYCSEYYTDDGETPPTDRASAPVTAETGGGGLSFTFVTETPAPAPKTTPTTVGGSTSGQTQPETTSSITVGTSGNMGTPHRVPNLFWLAVMPVLAVLLL